ncbi:MULTISPECIES: outer membrane protein Omp25 [Brucella/Ochrobactrum group]|jgi:outer membrane immunogenic protein|uniref:Outer membrane autotransporter barrel domain protein n=1 Tax=Ochrobactrum quorumnocens TaxID=271865 RepID=A0A248UJH3_9HYPH|nr:MULTISPECIES: outer membrane protein Omp25 [Brucella/Ochrobactrum group]MBD7990231.1 porin family protein [Ochrobactrum gallinarum]PRA86999.1 porin family protein [Ochrobactrum sp. MYb29]ASV86690.1 outer membrane autotransporter barrel domain protein [[Ochrobactrum] quorumnocens]KAA9370697.1 porin family protein [[Ochrobactrum] quorumnocens]MCK4204674.1 porin family protein [Brucella pituitosa]
MRTLKSLVIASAALLPFSATAFAADAIMEQPPVPAPVEMAPQSSWAGGYTGLYLGYGWNKVKTNTDGAIKPDDMKAGAYAGWNFQQDQFVYGVEGDAGYSWAKKSKNGLEAKQGFEGSLRGRLGYDLNPVMPYITAGVAGSQVKLDNGIEDESKFRVGWTAGAGLEAKLTENILGRVEYRYTQFGNKTYDLGTESVRNKLDTHDIRVGVGYKF